MRYMSFEEAYEEYKIFASKQQKKQSFESLTQRFSSHILPYFNGKDLKKISKNDIILWQQEILKFNFSNNYNKNLFPCQNQQNLFNKTTKKSIREDTLFQFLYSL